MAGLRQTVRASREADTLEGHAPELKSEIDSNNLVTFESLKPYWLVKKNYDDEISKVRSAIKDKSGLDAVGDELEYDDFGR